jgi:hypothetical protein
MSSGRIRASALPSAVSAARALVAVSVYLAVAVAIAATTFARRDMTA